MNSVFFFLFFLLFFHSNEHNLLFIILVNNDNQLTQNTSSLNPIQFATLISGKSNQLP